MQESIEYFDCDYRFVFKPLQDCQNEGCRALVWLPKTSGEVAAQAAPVPVVLMYHGGGWSLGRAEDVPHNQIRYLLKKGCAVVSIEYRFLPHVHFKELRQDCLDGYRYVQSALQQDLEKSGSQVRIDGSRASAIGWSAGGTICVYLASDILTHNKSNPDDQLPPLRAIVPTYGVYDELPAFCGKQKEDPKLDELTQQVLRQVACCSYAPTFELLQAHAPHHITPVMAEKHNKSTTGKSSGAGEIGSHATTGGSASVSTDPIDPASHIRMLWCDVGMMSGALFTMAVGSDPPYPHGSFPIDLITEGFTPTCVFMADADALVDPATSHRLYDRLTAQGVDVKKVVATGMAHGEAEANPKVMDWQDHWWEEAVVPSLEFALERMRR